MRTYTGIVIIVTLFFISSLIIPGTLTDSTYTQLHNLLDRPRYSLTGPTRLPRAMITYSWKPEPPIPPLTAEEIAFGVIGSILLLPAVFVLTKRR
jgi:hypothetical protein